MPSKLQQKLIERVRAIGVEVPDDVNFRRLYPGHWQISAGAWSWAAYDKRGRELMGSRYSMTELVKADAIDVYNNKECSDILELVPVNKSDNKTHED